MATSINKIQANIVLALEKKRKELQAMQTNPIRNRRKIKQARRAIQAISEGGRDILNTAITASRGSSEVIDKNNYKTYASKVQGCYDFYENSCDYGGEIFGGVADMRVSFIAGEGISFVTTNKAKEDYINRFLKENKLSGSRLITAVRMGEFEGKILWVLAPDPAKEKTIKARLFSWLQNKYTVTIDNKDYDQIKEIKYKRDNESEETKLPADSIVYVRLGGARVMNNNDTPTKLGKILTQCENVSRALYDARSNTHLFERVMMVFKTATGTEGTTLTRELNAMNWEIGQGYAGTAEVKLIEPTGASVEAIIKEITQNMRIISAMTGLPIHWLSYPDLMSNRATAENMLEVSNAATRLERLSLEEGITELIEKALKMAVDSKGEDAKILEGDLTVTLPVVSLAALQQIIDIWQLLFDAGHIAQYTLRNKIPGIDPSKEDKLIEKERKKAEKESPMRNKTLDNSLNVMQNNADDEPDED